MTAVVLAIVLFNTLFFIVLLRMYGGPTNHPTLAQAVREEWNELTERSQSNDNHTHTYRDHGEGDHCERCR